MPNSPTSLIAIALILIGYFGIIFHTSGGTNIKHNVWIFLPPAVKSVILDVFFMGRFLHKDKNLNNRKLFAIPFLLGIVLYAYQKFYL